jgi:hypothetical protein
MSADLSRRPVAQYGVENLAARFVARLKEPISLRYLAQPSVSAPVRCGTLLAAGGPTNVWLLRSGTWISIADRVAGGDAS